MKTEDEARKLWCPFARYLAVFTNSEGRCETAGSYNRGAADSSLGKSHCIASQCAAWRWVEWKEQPHEAIQQGHPAVGFCGLAGKPS